MQYRIGLLAMVLIMIALGVFFSLTGASYAHKIIPGVQVDNVDLGGLTEEQARAALSSLAESTLALPIKIKHQDGARQFKAGELGVSVAIPATIKQVLQAGQTGSIWKRLRDRHNIKTHGLNLKPVLVVDRKTLEKRIKAEFGEIMMEPRDAGFKINHADKVEIVPGQAGQRVGFNTLEKAMVAALVQKTKAVPEVDLPLLVVEPKRSTEDIENMGINGLIAHFSTTFNPNQAGRTYNVKVAAAALDGILVAPGEEFSFNRLVGPRSSEAGYKNALVIINNEFVEGVGGGVCQVSSTLYNVVLLAGLKITERSNHSLPVGYVPIGRDATVVYDALDFRFINNKDSYIYIKSLVEGGTLTFKIYGDQSSSPRVELASRILEEVQPQVVYENDPHLASGEQVVKQQGTKGFKVATTRTLWLDGQKTSEDLPASYYQPVPRIIAVGTGAVQPSVVTPHREPPGEESAPVIELKLPGNELPGDVPRDEQNLAPAPEVEEIDATKPGEGGQDNQTGSMTDKVPEPEVEQNGDGGGLDHHADD